MLQSVHGRSRYIRPNDSSQQIQETEEVVHIFLKIVLLSIYNAYILEGYKHQHTPGGRRKRDLVFQEDLCVQLASNFPQQHKSTASNKRRRSGDTPVPAHLTNVRAHFPFKGEGKNQRCVVCERKHIFLSLALCCIEDLLLMLII